MHTHRCKPGARPLLILSCGCHQPRGLQTAPHCPSICSPLSDSTSPQDLLCSQPSMTPHCLQDRSQAWHSRIFRAPPSLPSLTPARPSRGPKHSVFLASVSLLMLSPRPEHLLFCSISTCNRFLRLLYWPEMTPSFSSPPSPTHVLS